MARCNFKKAGHHNSTTCMQERRENTCEQHSGPPQNGGVEKGQEQPRMPKEDTSDETGTHSPKPGVLLSVRLPLLV